jgi:hypothetical protein
LVKRQHVGHIPGLTILVILTVSAFPIQFFFPVAVHALTPPLVIAAPTAPTFSPDQAATPTCFSDGFTSDSGAWDYLGSAQPDFTNH